MGTLGAYTFYLVLLLHGLMECVSFFFLFFLFFFLFFFPLLIFSGACDGLDSFLMTIEKNTNFG